MNSQVHHTALFKLWWQLPNDDRFCWRSGAYCAPETETGISPMISTSSHSSELVDRTLALPKHPATESSCLFEG